MARTTQAIALLVLVTMRVHAAEPIDWQLPIAIGDSRFDVYNALGIPNEVIDYDKMLSITDGESGNPKSAFHFPPERSNEYFYDRGLFIGFWHDAVFLIVVWGFVEAERGNEYTGPIVNNLTIDANRSEVVEQLGVPDLMRTDPLNPSTTDSAMVYSFSYLFWIHDDYQIEVQIANHDQTLNADDGTVRPVDKVSLMRFTSLNHIDTN